MFQTNVVQKIKTHILYSITFFFQKSCRLWDDVEKYGRTKRVTGVKWYGAGKMWVACWI